MNRDKYITALVQVRKEIERVEKDVMQPLKDRKKELTDHILKFMLEDGIKTMDHPMAQVQVRTRNSSSVDEDAIHDFLKDNIFDIDDEVWVEIWPATFNAKAAMAHATKLAPHLIHSESKDSLAVVVKDNN